MTNAKVYYFETFLWHSNVYDFTYIPHMIHDVNYFDQTPYRPNM